MDFEKAQIYLLSLGNEVEAMKLGLENIRTLLGVLGDPQNRYRKVQIAGTNGKGSVGAYLGSICRHAGVAAGLYTSPHLLSVTERISINDKEIPKNRFASAATTVREVCEELLSKGRLKYRPTFFEQMTAIALLAFADAGVDLAILETGMGGRLDATTAADAEIAVITRIDFDHQEYLGNTPEEIAAEKAAIIRADSRVIIGEQPPAALAVISRICADLGAAPRSARKVSANAASTAERAGFTRGGHFTVDFATQNSEYRQVRLGLAGRHQVENAKTAILAAEEIGQYFRITQSDIAEGLSAARNPGRLESVGQFLFDGAHNPGGARALREYLDEFAPGPITLIFGVMKGKDAVEMARAIFPKAEKIILARPSNSRAIRARDLRQMLDKVGDNSVYDSDSVEEAINLARAVTAENGIILVTGSLYLVGEVKSLINRLQSIV